MELIQTTPELASIIIKKGNRKIVTDCGYTVEWINLFEDTLIASKKDSRKMYDFDNVKLFIKVPKNAKKIY